MTAPFNNTLCIFFRPCPPPNEFLRDETSILIITDTELSPTQQGESGNNPLHRLNFATTTSKAALVNRARKLKLVAGDIDKANQSQWEFRLSYRVLNPVPHVCLALCYSRSTWNPLCQAMCIDFTVFHPAAAQAFTRPRHAVEGLLHLGVFAALVPSLSTRRLFAS